MATTVSSVSTNGGTTKKTGDIILTSQDPTLVTFGQNDANNTMTIIYTPIGLNSITTSKSVPPAVIPAINKATGAQNKLLLTSRANSINITPGAGLITLSQNSSAPSPDSGVSFVCVAPITPPTSTRPQALTPFPPTAVNTLATITSVTLQPNTSPLTGKNTLYVYATLETRVVPAEAEPPSGEAMLYVVVKDITAGTSVVAGQLYIPNVLSLRSAYNQSGTHINYDTMSCAVDYINTTANTNFEISICVSYGFTILAPISVQMGLLSATYWNLTP